MFRRLMSIVFRFIGVAALVAATYFYFSGPAPDVFALVVEEPNRLLDKVVAGREYDVAFQLDNRTGHAVRVIGSEVD